jgi:hypothetical protein
MGAAEQGRPGKGRPFTALIFTPYSLTCDNLPVSILLFANFFTSAFASERRFHAFLLTRLQVKGVAFHLFNNVFLLHLALEAAQSVFEGFTLLQSNFRQTDTPPNPSGRTE